MDTATRKPSSVRLGIIDYGMGNLHSVRRAWETTGATVDLLNEPQELRDHQALIFPGQGAIVDAMKRLIERGWDGCIRDWIAADRPFFGICLGLQALFDFSEEGNTPCLGIFPGRIRRFHFDPATGLKVPHMGWNPVHFKPSTAIGEPEFTGRSFYFVHSYYCDPEDAGLVWGETQYGPLSFCSAIARGNLFATQFHPEKSQAKGLALYRRFVDNLPQG